MPDRSTIARWAYENLGEVKDEDGKVIEEGFYSHYARVRVRARESEV